MKLSKDKRNNLVLVVLGSLVVAIAIYYGWVDTRRSQLVIWNRLVGESQNKLLKAEDKIKRSEAIEASADSILKELGKAESEMASAADPYAWSYLFIDRIKAGHEIDVTEVTRPQVGAVGILPDFPYPAATFTVRGYAYYHDLGRFISDFENRYPYFRVQNILLSLTEETGAGRAASSRKAEQLFFKLDIVALVKPQS
jgi:hypothetical protein